MTTSTNFAVLGAATSKLPGTIAALDTSGFGVRYDAPTDAYYIDLPYTPDAKFHSNGDDSRNWNGYLENAGSLNLAILKPSPTNPDIALSYTSLVHFWEYDYDDFAPAGVVAFGMATPVGAVPTTGSATFDAIVSGMTLDQGYNVTGTAALQFNFGAGTLAGVFNPITWSTGAQANVSLGTYNFVNTVFGIGNTSFSGDLQRSGIATLGSFNGLFTGPAAQELMARWSAPYENPDSHQISEMFGVWVGKRP